MTASNLNPEAVYDAEIAPLLLKAGKIAEEHGMALVCFAEWEPGETGSTHTLPENPSAAARIAYYAAQCQGNIDSLIMTLQKDGKRYGHGSLMLTVLERKNG